MKLKLLLAATACAAGVAFAQVAPLSAGNAQKDRAVPGTDAHKWRAHEGIKGAAPVAKPAAGFEIQDLRAAPPAGKPAPGFAIQDRRAAPPPAKPSAGFEIQDLMSRSGGQRAEPVTPAKPVTPQRAQPATALPVPPAKP